MRFFRRRGPRPDNGTDANSAEPERTRRAHTNKMLAEISRELSDWEPILRKLAENEAMLSLAHGRGSEITGPMVRSIIEARRLRDDHFWPAMSETAWTLLLEIYAGRLEGRRLDVDGLSAATAVPRASCWHWIDWLHGRGMIFRKARPDDEETAPIDLTDAAADAMRSYLLAALRLSPWVQ
jgi:hypothetical protein